MKEEFFFFSASEVPIGDRSRQIWRRETHQEPSSAAPVDQSAPSRPPEDFALRPAAAVPSPFFEPSQGQFRLKFEFILQFFAGLQLEEETSSFFYQIALNPSLKTFAIVYL